MHCVRAGACGGSGGQHRGVRQDACTCTACTGRTAYVPSGSVKNGRRLVIHSTRHVLNATSRDANLKRPSKPHSLPHTDRTNYHTNANDLCRRSCMRTATVRLLCSYDAYRLAHADRVQVGAVHTAACRTHDVLVLCCTLPRQQQPGLAVGVEPVVALWAATEMA